LGHYEVRLDTIGVCEYGKKALEIILAIYKSQKTGKAVDPAL